MRRMIATLAALSLLALPLAAQQAHGDHGKPDQDQKKEGMQGGMMEMGMGPLSAELGAYAPAKLLEAGKMLGLTAAQTERLTALRDGAKADVKAVHDKGHEAHMALKELMKAGASDRKAAETRFLAHHEAMGRMQWLQAAAALEARALLTDDQRAHVERMKQHHGAGKHEH